MGTLVESKQSTIAKRILCSGIGLHGGDDVTIALSPGEPGSGIVFVVRPRPESSPVEIPARFGSLLSSTRATSLTDGAGTTVSTVEHLLATLYVLELDNVRVEVQGSEIPMMDGSALPFIEWIRSAGRVEQLENRAEFDVARSIRIRDGERSIRIDPHSELRISYSIDFDHPSIGCQALDCIAVDETGFEREIAGARTFGFENEIESLRASGLALGGSFENAVVLGEDGVLNQSGLRWPDEFVRHKVIDLLGDLSLLGVRLNGHISVERGGHSLHHRLLEALIDRPEILVPSSSQGRVPTARRGAAVQSLA